MHLPLFAAFVQLKADQALDKAGKIIMADVQEVHHASPVNFVTLTHSIQF